MTKPYLNEENACTRFDQEQFQQDILETFENDEDITSSDFNFGVDEFGGYVQGFIHHDENTPEIAYSMNRTDKDDDKHVRIVMGELLHDVYRVQHSDVTDHLRKMYDNEMGRIRQIDRSQTADQFRDIMEVVEVESNLEF